LRKWQQSDTAGARLSGVTRMERLQNGSVVAQSTKAAAPWIKSGTNSRAGTGICPAALDNKRV
jgi:hypothetical protein